MTDLSDLVEAFKREVAVPGTFGTVFPSVTDDLVVGSLADAFAEAQLDGFFRRVTLDVDDGSVSPDLSTAGAALVVLYAGMRLVRQQLFEQAQMARYEAGPVKFERRASASVLTEALKALERRREQLVLNAFGRGSSVFLIDAYGSRGGIGDNYGGFFDYEQGVL